MRLLPLPEIPSITQGSALGGGLSVDAERVDSLETKVKSIQHKLENIEKRMRTMEEAQAAATVEAVARMVEVPEPAPVAPLAPAPVAPPPPVMSVRVSINTEAVKKGLMDKMWKYLNDEQPNKTV